MGQESKTFSTAITPSRRPIRCDLAFPSGGKRVVTVVTSICPLGSTMIETGTLNEEANYSGLADEQR